MINKVEARPLRIAVLKNFHYLYDKAGNRTSEQIDSGVAAATVNNLNQVTALSSTGPIHFAGGLSEPANVTVNGVPAKLDANNNFSADVPLAPGAHNVPVVATDGNGAISTKTYQVTVTDSGVNRTLTYDANGNLTNDGNGKTYTFDAANRMVSCTQTINGVQTVTGFVYDGWGHRVQETSNGAVVKQWVWRLVDWQPCEERDANNNVMKRFYALGEQINGTNYYFTKDRENSIRETTNSAGSLVTRYDYDPFGRRTLVSGTDLADFGFTGFYHDQATGLDFSRTRPYIADLGRWLSRDPIGERGGINLYRYCLNDPLNYIDPSGLWTFGIGVTFNFQIGPININFSGGFVIDGHGNVGTYVTPGGGLGVGGKASVGLGFSGSNAKTICDLGGPFGNVNFGGGLGPDAEVNTFAGNSPDGTVLGGGFSLGVGVGGGGSSGGSTTTINPW
jgi:RHS repeat-associated protein